MKVFYLVLIALFFVAACKKTPVASPTVYSFVGNTVQYGGNNYSAWYKDSSNGRLYFTDTFFIGALNSNKYVTLNFNGANYIDTGTYSNVGALQYFDGTYPYKESYGTYTITSLDTASHLISGTFQFTGICTLEAIVDFNVSKGTFTNVLYKTQ